MCLDGRCMCALGYGGLDCATITVPTMRDCSTGCVHTCAARCSKAAEGVGDSGCFVGCREKCASSCEKATGQRSHWVAQKAELLGPGGLLSAHRSEIGLQPFHGGWEAPTADYTMGLMASSAIGLDVPTAAAHPRSRLSKR